MNRPAPARELAIAFAAYLLLALGGSWPLARDFTSPLIAAIPFDPRNTLWILWPGGQARGGAGAGGRVVACPRRCAVDRAAAPWQPVPVRDDGASAARGERARRAASGCVATGRREGFGLGRTRHRGHGAAHDPDGDR